MKHLIKDFETIQLLVKEGGIKTIGIHWALTIFTWSWVYYYERV